MSYKYTRDLSDSKAMASKPDGTPGKLMDLACIRRVGWEPVVDLYWGIGLVCGNFFNSIHGELNSK